MHDLIERAIAVTREAGPHSIIVQKMKREFDRFHDAEVYGKFTTAEYAVFSIMLLSSLREALEKADREGGRIILA